MLKISRDKKVLIILTVIVTLTIVGSGIYDELKFSKKKETRIWFLDVGQGDSTLIRSHTGKVMLIDGGPDGSVLEGLSVALPWWERRIDVVVITHFDADHYVGLFGILARYEIGEIWWSGVLPTTQTGRKFLGLVRRQEIKKRTVSRGDFYTFDDGNEFEILLQFSCYK